ncbi:MAG TPA: 23S rRNA (adenine(2030)-N(6))-methyltransferase RlmJ [Rhizomicrobium sp.]|nr:23S rRNA (adenine(2030)-N(6))-methyltransferase RlmJ [Rhizomicrobium sp.]
MNYRHAFHAGNFADVIKHIALVAVLRHLRQKDKPFCIIDTHAGAGIYDLESTEAARTGEAAAGIGRLLSLHDDPQLPDALRAYLTLVKQEGEGRYPGSARIATRLLRPQDRLVAIERHPVAAGTLHTSLSGIRNARVVEADGYERLPALLPPHERRGVILIDPPYEAENEFTRVGEALAAAHRRFATGIYVVWYPIKSRAAVDALYGEASASGIGQTLRVEVETDRVSSPERERLAGAGLLIVNPPFGFDDRMRRIASVVAPLLGRTNQKPATITVV